MDSWDMYKLWNQHLDQVYRHKLLEFCLSQNMFTYRELNSREGVRLSLRENILFCKILICFCKH